jgi:hypothetical protein
MTHIAEPRVIGCHADMGPSRIPDIGAGRVDRREDRAAESRWDSEGGR